MFILETLPVEHGDCFWLEYGDPAAPWRILVDGGPTGSKALRRRVLEALAKTRNGKLHFELLVITHIDDDHIAGALDLLAAPPAGVSFGDVWFNGFKHLVAPDRLGPAQGERVSKLIEAKSLPWNGAFGGLGVVIPAQGQLPRVVIAGGMTLTLLSPTMCELEALRSVWKKVLAATSEIKRPEPADKMGRRDVWPPRVRALANTIPSCDTGAANGSSIALLAEFEGKSVLLGADAFAPVLEAAIERLLSERQVERLVLDVFKLPHHGSKHNMSNGLLQLLRCSAFLVSSSGKKFGHPDNEALARVIVHGGRKPLLVFNYGSRWNEGWRTSPPHDAPRYETRYPLSDDAGIVLPL